MSPVLWKDLRPGDRFTFDAPFDAPFGEQWIMLESGKEAAHLRTGRLHWFWREDDTQLWRVPPV